MTLHLFCWYLLAFWTGAPGNDLAPVCCYVEKQLELFFGLADPGFPVTRLELVDLTKSELTVFDFTLHTS